MPSVAHRPGSRPTHPPSPPPAAPDPRALLRRHATAAPHRPWLFFPEGPDWRWRSFAAVEEAVEALRSPLAAALESPAAEEGRKVAFRCGVGWLDLVVDLALRAEGFAAVPVGGAGGEWRRRAAQRGAAVGVEVEWPAEERWTGRGRGPAATPEVRCAELPAAAAAATEGGASRAPGASTGAGAESGPPGVVQADGRCWTAEDLDAAVRRSGPGARPGERGVAVSAWPLDRAAGRLLAEWALATGGALVLEPSPAALVATAAWARPTLFAGTPRDLERLAVEARVHEGSYLAGFLRRLARLVGRRRAPRPFGRLHTLVELPPAAGGASPSGGGDGERPRESGDHDFWRSRGIARITLGEVMSGRP